MRANLLARLAAGGQSSPASSATTSRVLPAIENAILAGQDIVFLGERGQAKTRMARLLVGLLDEWLPIVGGGELNDDPFAPVSAAARAHRRRGRRRTPDRLAAPRPALRREARDPGHHDRGPDRRGGPDPGRRGPLPVRRADAPLRAHPARNRGIFAINELPDLAERIQVGLLNILEERDVQIRGFTIRLPLDLFVVASANPEDYTSRGRIITPLKDRLGSQIRTHYPRSLDHEISIMAPGAAALPAPTAIPPVVVPGFMEELVAELTHLARRSPEISQRSGVSVRVSVANMEVLEAAAIKRAVRLGEPLAAPRVSDLGAVMASTAGKVEVETVGEDTPEERIVERLMTKSLFATFNRRLRSTELEPVVEAFEGGLVLETGERVAVARLRALDARGPGPARRGRAAGHVRRRRRRGVAGARRFGRRVRARGAPPPAADQQGPRRRRA